MATKLSRARILVVEDQEDVRRLLMTALEIEGYDVDGAADAHEGLKRLREARYNLVLSDYAMPGGTGAWMLREATGQGLLTETIALIVTAYADARDLSDVDVIAKPLDLDLFLDQVRRALNQPTRRSPAAAAETERPRSHRVELVLYVSPSSPASAQARRNVERVLGGFDPDQVKYSVCDLLREPLGGEADRVAFTPTLVKRYPAPRMWFLGNLRESEVLADMLRVCGVDAKK